MLSPCQAKPGPTKCFPLPLEPINTSAFVRHPSCGRSSETIGASPLEAGSETPEQQQDSSPCHAKTTPKKCLTLPLESIKENTKPLDDAPSKTPKTTEPHLNRRKMASEASTARMLFVAPGSPQEKEKIANLTKRFRVAGTATAKEKTHGSKRQSPI